MTAEQARAADESKHAALRRHLDRRPPQRLERMDLVDDGHWRDFERAPCVCSGRGYVVVPVTGGFVMTRCSRCNAVGGDNQETRCEHSGALIDP